MKSFVRDETDGQADLSDWYEYEMERPLVAQYKEDIDVFVLKTAEMIVREATPHIDDASMVALRQRMIVQIFNQKL
jgi:hypothetical protein